MKRLALRILVPVLFFAGWSACKLWDALTGAREVARG